MERMSRIETPSPNNCCSTRVTMPKANLPGTNSSTSLGDLADSLSSSCCTSSWLSKSAEFSRSTLFKWVAIAVLASTTV